MSRLVDTGACYLEWQPYSKDRTMGLNHQMASLSCSIAEAFYLSRTLVLSDRICLFGLHTQRWHPGESVPGERCVPIDDIFDTQLLSGLVPILLRKESNRTGAWARRHFPETGQVARVPAKGWDSSRVRKTYPCGGPAKLVRRHVDSFWFSQCTRHTTDTTSIANAVNSLFGALPLCSVGEMGSSTWLRALAILWWWFPIHIA
jgi:hypothetical protein